MNESFSGEIRTLGKDELITEPGFYQISMDRHHNQPCDGFSVTSSGLRQVYIHGPSKFWAYCVLNKNRYEQKDKTALRLGRAMASYIEKGPEGVEEEFFVLPSGKPNRPTEAQVAAYKAGKGTEAGIKSVEFWSKVAADPRSELTAGEWDMICSMGKEIAKDPAACAALGGIPEISMAWKDEATGIWCLARPDQMSFDGMQTDYKKVNTQGAAFNGFLCDRRIQNYRYDMQMGFACTGFKELTGNEPDQVGLIFQSDEPPHDVIVRALDEQDIRIGQFHNRQALDTIAGCLESGYWPGPGADIGSFKRNEKLQERYLEEMSIAGVTA